MSLTRLGYASIKVKDLASAVSFYTEVVGLRLIENDIVGRRAYLQTADNQDHHGLVLNEGERAGLDHAGYKVNDPADLESASKELRERGIEPKSVRAQNVSGQGEGIRFTAPSGHDILLYYHADKIGYATGMRNPDPLARVPALSVSHLDHVVLACEQPEEASRFFRELLGFYVTEQVNMPDGQPVAIFLTCSNTMHDMAIVPGPNGGFHHMAFGVDSRLDVVARTDLLKQRSLPTMELGVTRHGVAGVTTVYCHDPSGNRLEFAHGAYLTAGAGDRVPPVVWRPDLHERAVFFYEGVIPGDFFSTVT